MRRMLRTGRMLPVVVAWMGLASLADAGEGTPQTPCGRSVWIVPMVDQSIVHPGDGSPIEVPIQVFPYVLWNDSSDQCADPVSSAIGFAVTAYPDDGGDEIELPIETIPIGLPAVPGLQPVLTGPMDAEELGGPYDFSIAAGTLPGGVNYRCELRIEYQVTFGGVGAGGGAMVAQNETTFSIVRKRWGSSRCLTNSFVGYSSSRQLWRR